MIACAVQERGEADADMIADQVRERVSVLPGVNVVWRSRFRIAWTRWLPARADVAVRFSATISTLIQKGNDVARAAAHSRNSRSGDRVTGARI
jgi:hypothetical protein